jgi:hypothetical protein
MDAGKMLLTIALALEGMLLVYVAVGVLLGLSLNVAPATAVLILWLLTCIALYFGGKP